MEFEWDENKNKSNIEKHKISFKEAKQNKITWKQAVENIKEGTNIIQDDILFSEDLIPWEAVRLLNKAGIRIPKHLINYEEETIDYSDHPDLDELLNSGKYEEVFTITLKPEVAKWIKESKIDYNLLINNVLSSMYKSLRTN